MLQNYCLCQLWFSWNWHVILCRHWGEQGAHTCIWGGTWWPTVPGRHPLDADSCWTGTGSYVPSGQHITGRAHWLYLRGRRAQTGRHHQSKPNLLLHFLREQVEGVILHISRAESPERICKVQSRNGTVVVLISWPPYQAVWRAGPRCCRWQVGNRWWESG